MAQKERMRPGPGGRKQREKIPGGSGSNESERRVEQRPTEDANLEMDESRKPR